jgi:hypothetical protein
METENLSEVFVHLEDSHLSFGMKIRHFPRDEALYLTLQLRKASVVRGL